MVTRRAPAWLFAVLVVLAVAVPGARAQDAEERAKALFFEGHEAAARGDHHTACARFEDSLALFRRASTLLNLGECSEHLGLLADALRYWREGAATLDSSDERLALAKEKVRELEKRVPVLSVDTGGPLPSGAAVLVDGTAVPATELADVIAVDVGEHVLELVVPRRETATARVRVREGERREVHLLPGPPIATDAGPRLPAEEPANGQRVAGFVLGGVGLAAIVMGAVTGGLVLERKSTVEDHCADDVCDDQAGVDAASEGRALAIASTVGFVAGAALVAVGVVLVVTADDGEDTAVAIGPGSLHVAGRFP
jgi:exonuclease VII small subunit